MTKRKSVLQPCPFCGADAETPFNDFVRVRELYDPTVYVDGAICGSTAGVVICQRCSAMVIAETKEKAIKAWNRRMPKLDIMRCPRCGCALRPPLYCENFGYQVRCLCGAEGVYAKTPQKAAQEWNDGVERYYKALEKQK